MVKWLYGYGNAGHQYNSETLNERCFIQLTTHHLPDKLLQDMEVQKK